jgi:hypothetical protein
MSSDDTKSDRSYKVRVLDSGGLIILGKKRKNII